MAAIAFNRLIGPVPLQVIISEDHNSSIEVTKNPIETGAEVNDHAYIRPKKLVLEIADNNMVATWQALKQLQESRQPFSIVSGLDIYNDMLIEELNAKRDKEYSTTLNGTVTLRQVIIVDTTYATSDDGDSTAKSGNPGGKKSSQAAKPSSSRSTDATTSDRAAGQVQRGDNQVTPTSNTSYLKNLLSGSSSSVTGPVSAAGG